MMPIMTRTIKMNASTTQPMGWLSVPAPVHPDMRLATFRRGGAFFKRADATEADEVIVNQPPMNAAYLSAIFGISRPTPVYNLPDVHLPRLRKAGSPFPQHHPARQAHRTACSVPRLRIRSLDYLEGEAQPVGASWNRQGAAEGCIAGTGKLGDCATQGIDADYAV
jgi:hypothetical protein